MANLTCRLGKLDPNNPTGWSKFIVYKESDATLAVYALIKEGNIHKEVAKHFNLNMENVLGGGNYVLSEKGNLIIDDWSSDFGSIPEEVGQNVGDVLANHFRKEGINIQSVEISMPPIFHNPRTKQAWESLGYSTKKKS